MSRKGEEPHAATYLLSPEVGIRYGPTLKRVLEFGLGIAHGDAVIILFSTVWGDAHGASDST